MTMYDLDKAIFAVAPHFFVDTDEEKLEYSLDCGGRVMALLRAGQAIYFGDIYVTPDIHETLKKAYNDLKEHGHFIWKD